jgi:hypothetical protein
MARQSNYAHIYHPIIVTDASLWITEDGNTVSPEWVRFARSKYGNTSWWCDVVNSKYINEYARNLATHYDAWFRKLKCESVDFG